MTFPVVEVSSRTALKVTKEIARQFPFAVAGALNDTAKDFQRRQRQHQERVLEINRTRWFERAVKIKPFASGSSKSDRGLRVTISYDPPGASSPKSVGEDLFVRQERGGRRTPKKGVQSLAIAREDVRRAPSGVIHGLWRPRRIRDRGAFVITFKSGRRGIFRRNTRRGRGRSRFVDVKSPEARSARAKGRDPNLQFLYYLVPEADIDPVLDFFNNAEHVFRTEIQKNWIENWRKELRKAVQFQNRRLARRGLPTILPSV